MSWSIPITEEELRLIESTPGMLERINVEVNREFIKAWDAEMDRLIEREMHGSGTGEPVGLFFPSPT